MLILKTTDKLQLVTSSAAAIHVHASYLNNNSGAITGDRQNTSISSATTTDIVPAPGAGFTNVRFIQIRNKDASLPCLVTVLMDVSGTDTELMSFLLYPGDHLMYKDGVGFFPIVSNLNNYLAKVLSSDDAGGQAVNTVQPWFPTAGSLTVPAAATFLMRGLLKLTHGATSHSTGLSFGGTATLTSIDYYAQCHRSAADTIVATFSGIHAGVASNVTVDAAGTQAATYLQVKGIVRINAGGTFIPQFTFSANPTGTITAKRNSYFILQALGDNSFTVSGSWA